MVWWALRQINSPIQIQYTVSTPFVSSLTSLLSPLLSSPFRCLLTSRRRAHMLGKTHFLTGTRLSNTVPIARHLFARHSSSKLFLGGLSYDTNEAVLKDAFEQHGEIIEVKVICDHVNGKSKGYGFVQFTSEIAASAALKEMDNLLLDGRNIRVHYAHEGRHAVDE